MSIPHIEVGTLTEEEATSLLEEVNDLKRLLGERIRDIDIQKQRTKLVHKLTTVVLPRMKTTSHKYYFLPGDWENYISTTDLNDLGFEVESDRLEAEEIPFRYDYDYDGSINGKNFEGFGDITFPNHWEEDLIDTFRDQRKTFKYNDFDIESTGEPFLYLCSEYRKGIVDGDITVTFITPLYDTDEEDSGGEDSSGSTPPPAKKTREVTP